MTQILTQKKELDVHLMADGNLAVIHDESLKRTADADVLIADLTSAQLNRFFLEETLETIPLLEDVLKLFEGKAPMIVELKSGKNVDLLCRTACNLMDQYHIDYCMSWADTLNCKNYKGKIVVKAYSCMTLDYYWRVDDELYIGPYWYGYKSSDTITYKFASGGKGFQHYSEYFESLWNNTDLVKPLTQLQDIRIKRRKN